MLYVREKALLFDAALPLAGFSVEGGARDMNTTDRMR
jgi:hypothetical protein